MQTDVMTWQSVDEKGVDDKSWVSLRDGFVWRVRKHAGGWYYSWFSVLEPSSVCVHIHAFKTPYDAMNAAKIRNEELNGR